MIENDFLHEKTETYLKSLISGISNNLPLDFDSTAPFGELGLNSFLVLKVIKCLESDFGALPKTLLFEYFNVHDLSQYFVKRHAVALNKLVGISKESSVSELSPLINNHQTFSQPVKTPVAVASDLPAEAILTSEEFALTHSQLSPIISRIYHEHKSEASVSRGTRNIAPNLFIGSERRGFFNYARAKNIIMAYGYTGPASYFGPLVAELYEHCVSKGLELNLFYDEDVDEIAGVPFTSTPFGVMQRITKLASFSLQGTKMRRLRYMVSKFAESGECRTEEYICGTDSNKAQAIANVIDLWCESKPMVNPLIQVVRAEILAGNLNAEHRIFLTYMDEHLQNVILISPMAGDVPGYLMDLEFYSREMPLGGLEYAIVQIIGKLVDEGNQVLSLGGTYGCKLEPSKHADPEVDQILDDLRLQNIFNDEGNLQFKNKFRPENGVIYLCRPTGMCNPHNVIDIIMMIADPDKMQTSDAENHNILSVADMPTDNSWNEISAAHIDYAPRINQQVNNGDLQVIQGEPRSYTLLENDFNPLNIPTQSVLIDLKTDSWAQLNLPAIERQMQTLSNRLQESASLPMQLGAIFPFKHFILTSAGRTAESVFFESWPKKGKVLQNLLFPTAIFSQIENGFTPIEIPDQQVYDLDSNELFKAGIDLVKMKALIEAEPASISMVCIEVSNNAAGGYPVAMTHLQSVKEILANYNIPLVVDITRILENAQHLIDFGNENKTLWEVVRNLSGIANVAIASLAKDFCINKGGLIATNDLELHSKLQSLVQQHGVGLNAIEKKFLALSLQNRTHMESQFLRRYQAVNRIWSSLQSSKIPLVAPAGGHCILIDVKRIPEFNSLENPVPSFLAWLYLNTGIRAGAHSVGMQEQTKLNQLVRLAIPIGLQEEDVEQIITLITQAFKHKKNIPDLHLLGSASSADGNSHYQLLRYTNLMGTLISACEMPIAEAASPNVTSSSAVPLYPPKQQRLDQASGVTNKNSNALDIEKQVDAGRIDIAIIGMSGRYPKARNMGEVWNNLASGVNCVGEIPESRLRTRKNPEQERKYSGGFIDDIDKFDSLFFNISPREAETMDPQERLFLEVAWEALEDAGYYPENVAGDNPSRNVGVFVGAVWAMYQTMGSEERLIGNPVIANSFLWSIANRVSYNMNLSGPSMTVDTACSASLTALHLACEAIYRGDCLSAIVGGVNLDAHQSKYDITVAGGLLSEDSLCRSFGKSGSGYVAGEGVGAILIKPLTQAIKDRDNIQAVIKSVAINHGGKASGYSVPNSKAQSEVVLSAIKRAGIDASTIGYIEAHGTGTELGDPIEISGLVTAFSDYQVANQSCSIGSIKSNIGHLEAAAGLAGLCKVVLQMKHQQLVPSLHSAELNEFIDFENSPFRVQQTFEPWNNKVVNGTSIPLRAGISSFGAGGSNAHVILEQHEKQSLISAPKHELLIFPLSARNDDQLHIMASQLLTMLKAAGADKVLSSQLSIKNLSLEDIAFTLQAGRKTFDCKLAILASSLSELASKLELFLQGGRDEDVLSGSTKNNEGITRLLNQREKEQFIALLSKDRDARKMAQLWIDGLFADWQGLSLQGNGRRVSLPTYPFADKRHWIPDQGAQSTTPINHQKSIVVNAIHPMIDSNESTFNRQLFKKKFTDQEFFIYDHLVSDIPTLPGVAYLDFVRKAGEIAAGIKVQKIKNIVWVSPLVVKDSQPTVTFVELTPQGNNVQFEVFSERDDGKKQLYSQGKLSFATEEDLAAPSEFIDLESIKARSEKVIDGVNAYPLFKSLGLDLGPSFQVVKEVYKNETEVLGCLEIPEHRLSDFNEFILHPSLVDGAFQALMAAVLGGKGTGGMIVPYSLGEVEILHPLTTKCFSYLTDATDNRKPGSNLSKKNALIVDETGRVLVRVRDSVGVPLTDVHEKPDSNNSENVVGQDNEFSTLYYASVWNEKPISAESNNAELGRVVFFDTDDILRNQYAKHLRQQGKPESWCIWVKPGASFEVSNGDYTIDPQSPDDYKKLFSSLAQQPQPIVVSFNWSSSLLNEAQIVDASAVKNTLATGVYAFLRVCQSIIQLRLESKIQVFYVYNSTPENPQPHNEAINGFIKILRAESPRLSCRVLEFRHQDANTNNQIFDRLLMEFRLNNIPENIIRYHDQNRFICEIQSLDLDATLNPPSPQFAGIRPKGVYLITGGVGGLGLIFAEFLAREFQARLVLTGRSALSETQQQKIANLEKLGAEVLFISADVSNAGDVANLTTRCRSQFGEINGIIHSAGVLRDSYIRNKTIEEMESVFSPKIMGTLNLDNATVDDNLDFFVLFSSLAAQSGNAGQSDYAYANYFMDSFARRREMLRDSVKRRGKTLSLNWSLWADGGMRLDEQTELFFRNNLGIKPLSIETGVSAFVQGLYSSLPNFAVIEGVQEKIEKAWGLIDEPVQVEVATANNQQQSISSSTQAENAGNELTLLVQHQLSAIVMDFLKIPAEDIDFDTILLDLGFDSIGLTTFANAVNEKYGLDVTPVLFFEYPNIKEISNYIATEHSEEVIKAHNLEASAGKVADTRHSSVDAQTNIQSTPAALFAKKTWAPAEPEIAKLQSAHGISPSLRFIQQPIAIVGACGIMPQADNLDEYWEKLKNAENNMVTLIPEDRWSWEEYYGDPLTEENKTKSKWGGFMKEVDKFDPLFWGISPREAEMMDPQQRIFLETVWGAIEDAGHKVSDLAGTKTGLFVGAATRDYIDLMAAMDAELDGYSASGTSHAVLANRVSFLLDLRGPSAPLDTACSSSLVALHRAIESIHTGSSNMAIVGGVQVMLTAAGHISFGAAGMLASDGKCKTFDERADGYVRGEGSGAILIKTLAQAKADRNHIYAVVKATAENHGGKATMLTAPNPNAQADLLVEAYEKAQVDPTTVGYIECHGTGTSLGDPIEIQAMKKAFTELYKKHNKAPATTPHIGLTSAKTNIGHLETAAGIAGILKVIMSIKHKQIPALLHFDKLNPYINLTGTPFYIVDKTIPWTPISDASGNPLPRRAGISSFGFGGANVHIVLEEYVEHEQVSATAPNGPYFVVLSAKNQERLHAYAERLRNHIETNPVELNDLTYTLQVGRDAMQERLAFMANTLDEVRDNLGKYIADKKSAGSVYQGRVSKIKDDLSIMNLDGEMQSTLIKNWAAGKKYGKLLEAWVKGLDLDWEMLRGNQTPRRISLPTYPFARERYWFESSRKSGEASLPVVIHPLLHANTSVLGHLSYSSIFSGTEFFVAKASEKMMAAANYQCAQNQVAYCLSSMACVEMACAAIKRATSFDDGTHYIEIRSVDWSHPLMFSAGTQITIGLFESEYTSKVEEHIDFEIYTSSSDIENSQPELNFTQGQAFVRAITSETVNIKHHIEQLSSHADQRINDAFMRDIFVANPEYQQQIVCIYLASRQALVKLRVPETLYANCGNFDVHPYLTEVLINFSFKVMRQSVFGNEAECFPATIDSIKIFSPCPAEIYSLIRIEDKKNQADGYKVGIDICDMQGNICISIDGLCYSAIPTDNSESDVVSILAGQGWEIIESPELQDVLASDCLDFAIVDATIINAGNLVNKLPGVVVESVAVPDSDLPKAYMEMTAILFSKIKSIVSNRGKKPVQLQVVMADHQKNAVFSGLLGMLKTAEFEFPGFKGQIVITDEVVSEKVAQQIIRAKTILPTNPFIKFTSGSCFVWGTRLLDRITKSPENIFKDSGVYLITGGLGGLGKIFAKEILNKTAQSKVILTGRAALSSEIELKLQALSNDVNRLSYLQINLEDDQQVQQVINYVLQTHGQISGIIHAAGMVSDRLLAQKEFADVLAVLNPKVLGAINLDEATKDIDLDFVVYFSSIASVTGNSGQADYAAANGFLDRFAELRDQWVNQGLRKGKTLSINWPLWKEGGMKISEAAEHMLHLTTGMLPLRTESGTSAFYRGMSSDRSQLMVLEGEGKLLNNFFKEYFLAVNSAPTLTAPDKESITNNEYKNDIEIALLKRLIKADLRIP